MQLQKGDAETWSAGRAIMKPVFMQEQILQPISVVCIVSLLWIRPEQNADYVFPVPADLKRKKRETMIPTCKGCPHHFVRATMYQQNKWRYLHQCDHQNVHGSDCSNGVLGITRGFETKRKTSPRWCPLRKQGKV